LDRTQEEIRMALDAYHRELAKLNSVSSCPSVGSPAGLSGKPLRLHDCVNNKEQTSFMKKVK